MTVDGSHLVEVGDHHTQLSAKHLIHLREGRGKRRWRKKEKQLSLSLLGCPTSIGLHINIKVLNHIYEIKKKIIL